MQALLVLEDGFTLRGECFAGEGEVYGEVVFSTAMTGYQEMITDASFRGQMLTLTNPLIGNYGISPYDMESALPQVEALLVKEYCHRPRNRRSVESLKAFLERYGLPGVQGIDTRTLTLHLRKAGTMEGVLSTLEKDPAVLLSKLEQKLAGEKRNLVGEISCPRPFSWTYSEPDPTFPLAPDYMPRNNLHVVVFDFGVKYNTLRNLAARRCRVTVVPHRSTAAEIIALKPDGVLISNGPGDPVDQRGVVPEIQGLLGRFPVMGICLGHQLLAMALGFSTFKLTFGHRGGNHPVRDLATGRVQVTSQNHGYCVRLEEGVGNAVPTHLSLNDGTLEGLENKELRCFSVQYHPEASPGPHDSTYLFDRFIRMMDEAAEEEAEGGDGGDA